MVASNHIQQAVINGAKQNTETSQDGQATRGKILRARGFENNTIKDFFELEGSPLTNQHYAFLKTFMGEHRLSR